MNLIYIDVAYTISAYVYYIFSLYIYVYIYRSDSTRWCGTVQLVIEEKALEKDTNIRSTAMGVVPFHMMPEVRTPQLGSSMFHDRLFMT